jgi:hypothetical protein
MADKANFGHSKEVGAEAIIGGAARWKLEM